MNRTESLKGEESRRYEFPSQTIINIQGTNYRLFQELFADRFGVMNQREQPFTALSAFSAMILRKPNIEKIFERGTVFKVNPKRGIHWK